MLEVAAERDLQNFQSKQDYELAALPYTRAEQTPETQCGGTHCTGKCVQFTVTMKRDS